MRRIYYTILIAGILIAFATPIKAQVSFSFGININSQPAWGPTGYDEVQYYYLPDIDAYYYVPQHRFIYQIRGRWITSSNLPARYRNYDLYSGHKIVINENRPYLRDKVYREKYSSYKNRHDQQPIRDSHDSKYFVNKNHPEHNNWVKQQKQDNGRGKEQGKDKRNNGNNRQDKHDNQGNQGNQGNQNRQENHKK